MAIAPDAAAAGAARSCDNCAAALCGPYCHQCGAPVITRDDLSLRHFAADMAAEVTSLDRSKLGRTLWTLCFRPGQLTADNFTGRRVRYFKPIALTLAVFALHLFVFTAFADASSFNVRRLAPEQHESQADAGAQLWHAIERKAASSGTQPELVAESIDNQWIRNFSFFQIPLIVFLALWARLILLRVRSFMVVHFVFGMHLISFTGFTVVLMYPLLYLAGPQVSAASLALLLGKFVFDWTWVALAARRVYGLGTLTAALTGLAVQGGYFAAFTFAHQVALALAVRAVLTA